MVKIDRIIEDRIFKKSTPPFKVFEKRLTEALTLERQVMILKLGKRSHEYAKRQFIVFLISCFESYLQDMFALMIDKKIIKLDDILKMKKFKDMKFKLADIERIKNEKIKISEIITNEFNFQNFNEIMQLCSLIDFESHFDKLKSQFEKGDVGFTKKESEKAIEELYKHIAKSKSPDWNKPRFFRNFFKMVVRNLYRAPIHDLKKMYGTIILGLSIRHKIVHQASDFKLPHKVFHLGLFLSIMHFCAIIQEIYNIKSKKVHPSNN
ncbi:MAG: hypothetical protein ABIJ18_01275 [archaeon]